MSYILIFKVEEDDNTTERVRRQTSAGNIEPEVINGITQYHVEVVYMIDWLSVK